MRKSAAVEHTQRLEELGGCQATLRERVGQGVGGNATRPKKPVNKELSAESGQARRVTEECGQGSTLSCG